MDDEDGEDGGCRVVGGNFNQTCQILPPPGPLPACLIPRAQAKGARLSFLANFRQHFHTFERKFKLNTIC